MQNLIRQKNFALESNREVAFSQTEATSRSLKRTSIPTVEEARIASLKVLAMTLLNQVESLESQIASDNVPQLNLQTEVRRFEAAIIRSALYKTGGRQRRAARLLGVKVTTLNTKIKRHKIKFDDYATGSPTDIDQLLPPS